MSEDAVTGRMKAMLRAVHDGRGELSGGSEPDLYVDGLPCCDFMSVHALVHGGYVAPSSVTALCERRTAVLTELGRASL